MIKTPDSGSGLPDQKEVAIIILMECDSLRINFFCLGYNFKLLILKYFFSDVKSFFSKFCPELKLHRAEAASMAGGAR